MCEPPAATGKLTLSFFCRSLFLSVLLLYCSNNCRSHTPSVHPPNLVQSLTSRAHSGSGSFLGSAHPPIPPPASCFELASSHSPPGPPFCFAFHCPLTSQSPNLSLPLSPPQVPRPPCASTHSIPFIRFSPTHPHPHPIHPPAVLPITSVHLPQYTRPIVSCHSPSVRSWLNKATFQHVQVGTLLVISIYPRHQT